MKSSKSFKDLNANKEIENDANKMSFDINTMLNEIYDNMTRHEKKHVERMD